MAAGGAAVGVLVKEAMIGIAIGMVGGIAWLTMVTMPVQSRISNYYNKVPLPAARPAPRPPQHHAGRTDLAEDADPVALQHRLDADALAPSLSPTPKNRNKLVRVMSGSRLAAARGQHQPTGVVV
mmetsp:Transcript_92931/g.265313  ORF Transcript_92931/g.265313 Transcript_92931/m.265313 type:complete len:125 (+) Transcript_92931:475-849(+)